MSTTIDGIDGTARDATLHVFLLGDTDYIVAYSIDDAWSVWSEIIGEKREDYDGPGYVKQIDDGASISICDEGETTTLKAWQWIDLEGRGMLCSTEY